MKKKLPDVAKQLQGLLPLHGFSRKSSTWRRDNGWCIDVIEFQRSQFESSFTINIGVLTKSVHAVAWGGESPAHPMAAVCTVEERLNALTKRGGGWWDTDDDNWLAGVTADIQQVVLPFLERMHDRKGQRDFLENRYPPKIRDPLKTIYLAILIFELGERAEACSLLKNYKPRGGSDGWAVRRAEVAGRLGCS
jgi:hypothetical protein